MGQTAEMAPGTIGAHFLLGAILFLNFFVKIVDKKY
jgi:hypothetical protein